VPQLTTSDEIKALEERLVAKHQKKLNKATDAAMAAARIATGTCACTRNRHPTPENLEVAIDATVAAKEAELRVKHDTAIGKGRRERPLGGHHEAHI
jgi:hypothetical protein